MRQQAERHLGGKRGSMTNRLRESPDRPILEDEGFGSRLRHLRLQTGLSLQAVERSSNGEFKASVVGAYERGDRGINVTRLIRLTALYGVPVSTVFEDTVIRARVDLVRLALLDRPESDMVLHYLNAAQLQRSELVERTMTLTSTDLHALGRLLHCDQEDVVSRLQILGVTTEDTKVADQPRHRILTEQAEAARWGFDPAHGTSRLGSEAHRSDPHLSAGTDVVASRPG